MKRYIILLIAFGYITNCTSQKVVNQLKFDEKANKEVLYGFCDVKGLQTAPFNEWYDMEFNDYQPDMETIGTIENNGGLSGVNISIVMGTWCSDSRREVPRFFKILNLLAYDANRITIISVDRDKKAEATPVAQMNIEKVPTFILSNEDTEVGRIIETPETSLEGDILKILENL